MHHVTAAWQVVHTLLLQITASMSSAEVLRQVVLTLCLQVIGLACFKAVSADGVSFAIPIDTAKDVIQQLQQRGRVIRPYIGIKMLQLNQHNAAQMRQKDPNFPEVMQGILVPFVAANSPAAKCGLREGDVITGACGAHNCMHDCSRATVDHAHSILRPQIKQQRAAECSKHACRYA